MKRNFKKLLSLLLCIPLLLPFNTSIHAMIDPNHSLINFLPQNPGYSWRYNGSVEYGHLMTLTSVVEDGATTYLTVHGEVDDLSDGESNGDYSLQIVYELTDSSFVQVKDETMMLDSRYDRIELLRAPLNEGAMWQQTVYDEAGELNTLECTIESVTTNNAGHTVYTVYYDDIGSEYYERRELEQGVGVTRVIHLYEFEDSSYEMGYSLTQFSNFEDVPATSWYNPYLIPLTQTSAIGGYPDGLFHPNDTMTVAQFLKVILVTQDMNVDEGGTPWYMPYVNELLRDDIITEDTFTDYNAPISREDMAMLIVRVLNLSLDSQTSLNFNDTAAIDAEHLPYIKAAVDANIMEGYPDNTFRPKATATRAEVTKLIAYLYAKSTY